MLLTPTCRRQGAPLRGVLLRRYAASRRCATLAGNGGRVRPCGDSAASAAYSPTWLSHVGPLWLPRSTASRVRFAEILTRSVLALRAALHCGFRFRP